MRFPGDAPSEDHTTDKHLIAWTQAGCKNADNDPNADKGDDYKAALPGWCRTKKAGVIFFWLAASTHRLKPKLIIIKQALTTMTSP